MMRPMSSWSRARVEAMAPDSGSIAAAAGLARRTRWPLLGRDETCAWGECQGSGVTPYQVRTDLTDGTFRCSCPSRKQPCKHVLALLLLIAASEVDTAPRPAFVDEWLAARLPRADHVATKAQTARRAPDPEAQARRAEKREARVDTGLRQLDAWMVDLIGQGLAAARSQPSTFWESMAARLVDAQAPGLARRVRALAGAAASSDWQMRLLRGLARLQVLGDAYRAIDRLPPSLAAEVRTLVGWTQNQDALLAREGTRDRWQALGVRRVEDEQMTTQYAWLRGLDTAQMALLLDFAVGAAPLRTIVEPGDVLEAELVFFDGEPPLRAVLKTRTDSTAREPRLPHAQRIASVQATLGGLLARNPFLDRWPVTVGPVRAVMDAGRCTLIDDAGARVPTLRGFRHGWHLVSLTRYGPVDLFGEWSPPGIDPVSVASGGRLFSFASSDDVPVVVEAA